MATDRKFSTLYSQIQNFPSPEIPLTKEDVLLKQLINDYGFSKTVINVFNYWINTILPQQIEAEEIQTQYGVIRYGNVKIEWPMFPDGTPMTPYICRERSLTYEAKIKARLYYVDQDDPYTIHYHGDNRKNKLGDGLTEVGRVPILLGSCRCHLEGLNTDEKILSGESPNDPLGYFIIKGTEKVVTIQEKLRISMNYTFIDAKGHYDGRMTCLTSTGTSLVSIAVGKKTQALKVGMQHIKKSQASAGVHRAGKGHLPLFIAFFVLQCDTRNMMHIRGTYNDDQYDAFMKQFCFNIIDTILIFCTEEQRTQVAFALQTSVAKALSIGNIIDYIGNKRGFNNMRTHPDEAYEQIRKDVLKDLYSHISIDDPNTKILHLAFMTSNMIKNLLGMRPTDDRDSWANKRLVTGAGSMEQLFGNLWNKKMTPAIKLMQNEKGRDPVKLFSSVNGTMNHMNLGDEFSAAFQPNCWGVKNNSGASYPTKDNITDTLKAETPLAVYSQVGRVNTPGGRHGKNMNIRMIQPSQTGLLCSIETPEGDVCGLLKNMSLLCIVSMQRPTSDIESILLGGELNGYHSFEYSQGWIPFILNGTFRGYCLPGEDNEPVDILGRHKTRVEQFLLECKRNGRLPFDCCINYNRMDNIMEYYCDSCRPIRPLLIVNESGELVVDQKKLWRQRSNGEFWVAPTSQLINEGAIEFVDAREQEYIMLAMFPHEVRKRHHKRQVLQKITNDRAAMQEMACDKTIQFLNALVTNPGKYIVNVCEKLIDYYSSRDENHDEAAQNILECFAIYVAEITQYYASHRLGLTNEPFNTEKVMGLAKEICMRRIEEIMTQKDVGEVNDNVKTEIMKLINTNTFDIKCIIIHTIKEILNDVDEQFSKLNKSIPYSHSEIDPIETFGIAGALEPQCNSQQGPRSTYQASMCKQALGYYHYNHHLRFDTSFKVMCNPSRPIFETLISEDACLNSAPTGTTPICAFLCMTNNNEDGLVVKKEYIDGINLEIIKYSTHKTSAVIQTGVYEEKFKHPGIRNGEIQGRYAAIGEGGLPRLDAYIRPGDCIIGKVRINKSTKKETNTSVFAGVGEEGFIDRIMVTTNSKSHVVVKVKIRQFRKHISGDKVASRYAQKGTISQIIPERELPRIVGGINDGLVPDFYINPHCFTGDTPVTTYYGVSRRIDSFSKEVGDAVWGFNTEKDGFTPSYSYDLRDMGEQDVIQITMMDGRKVKCTPDHKILTLNDKGEKVFVEAKDLIPQGRYDGQNWVENETLPGEITESVQPSRVVMGLEAALDAPDEKQQRLENEWELETDEYYFSMRTENEREKSLAFMRILGAVQSDGTIIENKDSGYRSNLNLGHAFDLNVALRDVELITGKRPASRHSGGVWTFALPATLARAVGSVSEMGIGKQVTQESEWPRFLFEEGCPISNIREFLGGLFGGDGHAPCLYIASAKNRKAKSGIDRLVFRGVKFAQSIIETYKESFRVKMEKLCLLLTKVGVEGATVTSFKNNEFYGGITPIDPTPRVSCGVNIPTNTSFGNKVGFRYCIDKTISLTAAQSYWRYIEEVKRQHNTVFQWASHYYDTKQATNIQKSLDKARTYLLSYEPPLNEYYSLLTRDIVDNRRRPKGRQETLQKLDYGRIMDPAAFFTKMNMLYWFEGGRDEITGIKRHKYVVTHDMDYIPSFAMPVMDIRYVGKERVYDIAVDQTHTFLANGLCVSNCLSSRMTMGKIKEMLSSKAALYTGERVDGTTFHPFNLNDWIDKLRKLNVEYAASNNETLNDNLLETYAYGEEIMYWPDGTKIVSPVFIGPCNYQCLRHHAKDKIQARARGAMKALTRQPVGGRTNSGGMRVGEMERDALCSHSATGLILERLMRVSDAYKTVYCKTCGNIAIADHIGDRRVCRLCEDKAEFGVAETPYVLKLIIHCLLAMHINVTMKFKKSYNEETEEAKYLL